MILGWICDDGRISNFATECQRSTQCQINSFSRTKVDDDEEVFSMPLVVDVDGLPIAAAVDMMPLLEVTQDTLSFKDSM